VISPDAWGFVSHRVRGTPLSDLVNTPRKVAIQPEHYDFYRIESLIQAPDQPEPIIPVRFRQKHLSLLRRWFTMRICAAVLIDVV
jgi:hypothetical protein